MINDHLDEIGNLIKTRQDHIKEPRFCRFIINKNEDPVFCPICNLQLFHVMDISVEDGFKAIVCENLNHFFVQSYRSEKYFKQTKILTDWPNKDDYI